MKDLGFLRYQSEPIGKHDYRHVRLLDSSIMKKGSVKIFASFYIVEDSLKWFDIVSLCTAMLPKGKTSIIVLFAIFPRI